MSNHQVLLGSYVLEKLIGRGAFGEVWRAATPGSRVAVKLIRRPAESEERQREIRSLEVICNLRHPFLISTFACYSEEDRLVIVMDLEEDRLVIVMDLADSSLRDRLMECLKQGLPGIPATELIGYFRESAEAVDYLHEKEMLHRNIKPDSMLLVEGHVRLADFGLAELREQLGSAAGVPAGTPAYMAPEVWARRPLPASDQYSLACTYAELRLGRRPFESGAFVEFMFAHMNRQPDLESLPEGERRVLLKALAKNPDDRHPSCSAFVAALADGRPGRLRG